MRVRRLATAAAVWFLTTSVASCGQPRGAAPTTATTRAAAATSTTTGTTSTSTSVAPASPPTTPPCPAAHPEEAAADNAPSADPTLQDALAADNAAVRAYGDAHPDDWGGSGVAPTAPGRLLAYVTRDRETHEAAMRKLVTHPELLDVAVGRYTVRDLAGLRGEIEANVLQQPGAPPMVLDIGDGLQTIDLNLAPGREGAAAALLARYGNSVRLRVAGMPYVPRGCGPQPVAPRCADVAGAEPASVGLALKVEAYNPTMAPWDFGHGALSIENTGTKRYKIDPGNPVEGVLVEPGTTHVVGRSVAGIAGTGLNLDLAPGDKGGVEVVYGAARCDGQPGSALPPGTYGLRVLLVPEGAARATTGVLSPEIPITITAG